MKKTSMLALALLSTAVLAAPPQGAGGPPAGAGAPGRGGPPEGAMRGGSMRDGMMQERTRRTEGAQQERQDRAQSTLRQSQLESGAWRKLQERTGLSSEQLQAMYAGSGARNFGEFTAAITVSKNLNLDTAAVLEGLKTDRLGQTLVKLGVDKNTAEQEVRRARRESGR